MQATLQSKGGTENRSRKVIGRKEHVNGGEERKEVYGNSNRENAGIYKGVLGGQVNDSFLITFQG